MNYEYYGNYADQKEIERDTFNLLKYLSIKKSVEL